MEYLIALAWAIGVLGMFAILIGVTSCGCYLLWKILAAFRHMEWTESVNRQRGFFQYNTASNPSYQPSKEEVEGGFQPYSEVDAYTNELTNRLKNDAGITDAEAANIILEKIRLHGSNKADV